MRDMVERGEVDALVPERVWQETEKALREPKASEFLQQPAPVRRAEGHLPGNRRPVRRTATGPMASGDRHGRAYADGARSGRLAQR